MGNQRPTWASFLFIAIIAGGLFGLMAVAGIAGYFLLAAPPGGSPSPEPAPSPTIPTALGAISGQVWHDQCAVSEPRAGEAPTGSTGCLPAAGGGFTADGIHDASEPPLAGVEVSLGIGACPAQTWKASQALGDGTYIFTDLLPGTYCVTIDSANQPSLGLQPGHWTVPASALDSAAASVSVDLAPGESRPGIDFGWDYQFLPVVEPSPTPGPTAPPPAPSCTDKADFVADVTIPDGTWVTPGSTFEKIWRLRNSGTCTWSSGYTVAYVSGSSLGASVPSGLGGVVAPGATVDVSLDLTAPQTAGSYRGNWMLRNTAGVLFGVGPQGQTAFWTLINVANATGAAAGWRGEYFDNRQLSGSPEMTRQDRAVDFDWGQRSPASGISADDFSIRWTAEVTFAGGSYDFLVGMDDGARLYIDGTKVLDEWKNGAYRESTVRVPLVQGKHTIRLEYYERTGNARVRLNWAKTTDFPNWKGEYFANRDLNGAPALVRNDKDVNFDWGSGGAATGLPSDNFSVRWTAKITFEPGRYRLNAQADDGVRVYVDGKLLISEWHDSAGTQVYSVERDLATKTDVVVEYYERGGSARVRFWIEKLGTATSTVSPTASQTVTPSPSATASVTATTSPTSTASPTATETPSQSPTPSGTPTPSETPTETPLPTATCEPIECGPVLP